MTQITAPFINSYAQLPSRFYARLEPKHVKAPDLITFNSELAEMLGAEGLEDASILAGNTVPESAKPLAAVYAGHQFGTYNPKLGDGRALLLGELLGKDGHSYDVQLKGSGPTPFSRNGDGRAWLGPVLREYVMSEAMAALGVPTTRALGAASTGEQVYRERKFPGAVLTRVAKSHVRVGTFQYFAAQGDIEALTLLTDYTLKRLYPEAVGAERPALALLKRVIERQARLIAKWLSIGFIHGVMNTDNMALSGETIDYGPCAFMDGYDHNKVFSFIDEGGRYAFSNQPMIGQWNLGCFAQALLPIIDEDETVALELAQEAINGYGDLFEIPYQAMMRAKIGLQGVQADDNALVSSLLALMHADGADFTQVFRALSLLEDGANANDALFLNLFTDTSHAQSWLDVWRGRLMHEADDTVTRQAFMQGVNPAFVPRNHMVEAMIKAALEGNYAPFHEMVEAVKTPYGDNATYMAAPQRGEEVMATHCGT